MTTTKTAARRPTDCGYCELQGIATRIDAGARRRWMRGCGARAIQMCDGYRGRKSEMPCVVCVAVDTHQPCNAAGCDRIVAICYDCADAYAAYRLSVESGYCAMHIDDSEVDWDWRADYDLPVDIGKPTPPGVRQNYRMLPVKEWTVAEHNYDNRHIHAAVTGAFFGGSRKPVARKPRPRRRRRSTEPPVQGCGHCGESGVELTRGEIEVGLANGETSRHAIWECAGCR